MFLKIVGGGVVICSLEDQPSDIMNKKRRKEVVIALGILAGIVVVMYLVAVLGG